MRPLLFLLAIALGINSGTAATETGKPVRILVVSSYDRSYLWSQETQAGLVQALIDYQYLDNAEQGAAFTANDHVRSEHVELRKEWMDTKRRSSPSQMAAATERIMGVVADFKPDLVMLGDDNAANYIGNQLLDTATPVVFWGINGLPLKYGLVDSMDAPGHNVTGVWQAGYHQESLELLSRLVPEAKTFAILSCDSVSARPKVKQIRSLARRGLLPLELVDTVMTNSFTEFKTRAMELSKRVDAFFVLNHDTMTDDDGNHVNMLEVGRWYLQNILKPDVSHEGQFVLEGILATANDSGYNQSYAAFQMAYDILEQGLNPGRMRTQTPPRGPFMVNQQRARMLGIDLSDKLDFIDELVPDAVALR